jgi:hypothetical protein
MAHLFARNESEALLKNKRAKRSAAIHFLNVLNESDRKKCDVLLLYVGWQTWRGEGAFFIAFRINLQKSPLKRK